MQGAPLPALPGRVVHSVNTCRLREKIGVELRLAEVQRTASLRDILAQAILNGAEVPVRRSPAGQVPQLTEAVLACIRKGVPDTLQALAADQDALRAKAEAAVRLVQEKVGRG